MPTYYKVEFSKRAETDYYQIIEYLLHNWSKTEARQFILDIDKEIARIIAFPYAFPASGEKKEVRRCVVSRINTIYYKVAKSKIFIITIFDNRQQEVKLP